MNILNRRVADVLLYIGHREQTYFIEIQDNLMISPKSLAKILTYLEKEKLIIRADIRDSRRRYIRQTGTGKIISEKLWELMVLYDGQ